jgi:hypothetical protein
MRITRENIERSAEILAAALYEDARNLADWRRTTLGWIAAGERYILPTEKAAREAASLLGPKYITHQVTGAMFRGSWEVSEYIPPVERRQDRSAQALDVAIVATILATVLAVVVSIFTGTAASF